MRIDVSAHLVAMPYKCACCGGAPDTELTVHASRTWGKRVQHTQTKACAFPYCEYCIRHIRAAKSARTLTRTLVGLSILAGILVGTYADSTLGAVVALLALVGTALTGGLYLARIRSQCKPTCASVNSAVSYLGWHGTLHKLELESLDFARDFVARNERKVVNLSPSARALLAAAVPTDLSASIPVPPGKNAYAGDGVTAARGEAGRAHKRQTSIIAVAIVALVALAGVFYWQTQRGSRRNSAAIVDNRPGRPARGQYGIYLNQRFGFSIRYPASFIRGDAPTNGDGATFTSPDGEAALTAAGGNNPGLSLQDLYKMSLGDTKGRVQYNKIGGNWFVISWDDGETIGYMKMFVGSASHNSFIFTYPRRRASYYGKLVVRLEASFRPGDLDDAR